MSSVERRLDAIDRRLGAIEDQMASHFADTHRHLIKILQNQETIMSKISDFAGQMNAFTDRQDKAVSDLQEDIKVLNDKITELQNTAGDLTKEDQDLLNAIQARASAVADKLDALDALTPPAVPNTP